MNRILISLTAIAAFSLAMCVPTSAEAAFRGHPAVHGAAIHHVNGYHNAYGYGSHYGNNFGRYYPRAYRGWSQWYWNPRYGCYFYLSPINNSWYYYYGPSQSYLPTASIATYPPVAAPGPIGNPLVGQLPGTPPLPPGY